ncbi:MAG: phenylacetate--CoA ligase [Proteobacteria bacterium]|nr:phenylacetate--CoA ligase [Pseudomonadota bacterium]
MYWQQAIECMPREDLEQLQLERLQATLYRLGTHVPFYRRKLREAKIDYEAITSLAALRNLPFTMKEDLHVNYPYGLFAVPLRDVVRIHSSSGNSGMTTVIGYTRNDIKNWSDLVARILCGAGVTAEDVVQIAYDYGIFTGGLGFHYGAERLGASVIPISSGNIKRQIRIMRDFKTTALVCTPSHALKIADVMMDMGVNSSELSLKYGVFGAERWSETMRREIGERLGITANDNYGLSEIMGPGVAGECLECNGLHINEDHFFVEILDTKTLEPVAEGEVGELVITTLTKEAFPVIRYRTRDLARFLPGTCPCGRTFTRMSGILGRSDDMMIIKGVNVFPAQIEAALTDITGSETPYLIIVDRENHEDKLTVMVEVTELLFSDQIRKQWALGDTIQDRLVTDLGIQVHVKLVEEKTLETIDSKGKKVIDNRTF